MLGALLKQIFVIAKMIWTKGNEIVLNIDTMPDQPISEAANGAHLLGEYAEQSRHHDNIRYESPDYWCLRKVANVLRARDNHQEVFYDLGAGKGRVLCVMARQPFKRVVGVELFESLCRDAKQNAARLRGRKAPIEIVCEDAARVDLSGGTIYFMYHPFGPATLCEVITHIETSLLVHPRAITIVYYNAVHEAILQSCAWLQLFHVFHTATRRRVSFWRNKST